MEPIAQHAAAVQKPAHVSNAVKLIYAGAGVGILNAVIDFPYLSSLVPPRALILQMAFTYAIILLLALKISLGRNWARIVFLIVFIFGLPAAIPSLVSHFSRSPSAGLLMLLTILLQMTANVLLFQRPSNAWFKRLKALRSGS